MGHVILDGAIRAGEWSGAEHLAPNHGLEILATWHRADLWLGIRAGRPGFPSVAVARHGEVFVLHASAALATARYEGEGKLKQLASGFAWELRTTLLTPEARAERAAFLARNGWVASTVEMGPPGESVVRIGPRMLAGATHFTVAWCDRDGGVRAWPDGVADASASSDLVRGFCPERAAFMVESWAPFPVR
jgi:hypothetical protein